MPRTSSSAADARTFATPDDWRALQDLATFPMALGVYNRLSGESILDRADTLTTGGSGYALNRCSEGDWGDACARIEQQGAGGGAQRGPAS